MDTLVNTIEDKDSQKLRETLGKEMSKALVKTHVKAINFEKVETVGETQKD